MRRVAAIVVRRAVQLPVIISPASGTVGFRFAVLKRLPWTFPDTSDSSSDSYALRAVQAF